VEEEVRAIGEAPSPQLNRVVRQKQPAGPGEERQHRRRETRDHPQPSVSWGTRATIPNPTMSRWHPRPGPSRPRSVGWETRSRFAGERGADVRRVDAVAVAFTRRRLLPAAVLGTCAEASAIATAPSAISSDPPITCP